MTGSGSDDSKDKIYLSYLERIAKAGEHNAAKLAHIAETALPQIQAEQLRQAAELATVTAEVSSNSRWRREQEIQSQATRKVVMWGLPVIKHLAKYGWFVALAILGVWGYTAS